MSQKEQEIIRKLRERKISLDEAFEKLEYLQNLLPKPRIF